MMVQCTRSRSFHGLHEIKILKQNKQYFVDQNFSCMVKRCQLNEHKTFHKFWVFGKENAECLSGNIYDQCKNTHSFHESKIVLFSFAAVKD